MVLVDSSVWIDYFNGASNKQVELLDQLFSQSLILVGDLIFTEVIQGYRSDQKFEQARQCLSLFPFRVLGSHDVALKSAENYRTLRKKGITVRKTIDVIIGTFCILEEIPLLHNDRDFEPMATHLKLLTFF